MLQRIAAFLCIAALGLTACSKKQDNNQPPSLVTATMNAEQAKTIEQALGGDKTMQSKALAPELQQAFIAQPQTLPKGLTVKIDMVTFKSYGNYGQATAETNKLGKFLVHFVHKDGKWFVLSTDKLSQQVLSLAGNNTIVKPQAAAKIAAEECKANFGKKVPVLFVHGLNGSEDIWKDDENTVYSVLEKNTALLADTFDYKDHHLLWIDHPEIGPKLAKRIACLAAESRKTGGDGKVIVIAHSSGGLATKFAAAQTISGRKVADDIGLVITLGTPNAGTPAANLTSDLLRAACNPSILPIFAGKKLQVGGKAECEAKFSAIFGLQAFAASGKIAALPQFPDTVPVLGIAGDVNIQYAIFTIPIFTTGNDLVVPVSSAAIGSKHEALGAGIKIIKCSGFVPIPNYSDAPCEHSQLPRNSEVRATVIAAINKFLTANPPNAIKFTFSTLTLKLPATWRVIRTSPGNEEVTLSNDASKCHEGSICPFVNFYRGTERKKEIWDNTSCKAPINKGSLIIGGKKATYYQQNCFNGIRISHLWELAAEQILIVSDQRNTEIETVLGQAQWS